MSTKGTAQPVSANGKMPTRLATGKFTFSAKPKAFRSSSCRKSIMLWQPNHVSNEPVFLWLILKTSRQAAGIRMEAYGFHKRYPPNARRDFRPLGQFRPRQ